MLAIQAPEEDGPVPVMSTIEPSPNHLRECFFVADHVVAGAGV